MSFSLRDLIFGASFFNREEHKTMGIDSLSLEESVQDFMANHPGEQITGEAMKEIIENAKPRH